MIALAGWVTLLVIIIVIALAIIGFMSLMRGRRP